MRVIYYFDKIRSSDAHRYPRRSISFFSPFFFPLPPPSVSGTEFVCNCAFDTGVCARVRTVVVGRPGARAGAPECGWVTIRTALGNEQERLASGRARLQTSCHVTCPPPLKKDEWLREAAGLYFTFLLSRRAQMSGH